MATFSSPPIVATYFQAIARYPEYNFFGYSVAHSGVPYSLIPTCTSNETVFSYFAHLPYNCTIYTYTDLSLFPTADTIDSIDVDEYCGLGEGTDTNSYYALADIYRGSPNWTALVLFGFDSDADGIPDYLAVREYPLTGISPTETTFDSALDVADLETDTDPFLRSCWVATGADEGVFIYVDTSFSSMGSSYDVPASVTMTAEVWDTPVQYDTDWPTDSDIDGWIYLGYYGAVHYLLLIWRTNSTDYAKLCMWNATSDTLTFGSNIVPSNNNFSNSPFSNRAAIEAVSDGSGNRFIVTMINLRVSIRISFPESDPTDVTVTTVVDDTSTWPSSMTTPAPESGSWSIFNHTALIDYDPDTKEFYVFNHATAYSKPNVKTYGILSTRHIKVGYNSVSSFTSWVESDVFDNDNVNWMTPFNNTDDRWFSMPDPAVIDDVGRDHARLVHKYHTRRYANQCSWTTFQYWSATTVEGDADFTGVATLAADGEVGIAPPPAVTYEAGMTGYADINANGTITDGVEISVRNFRFKDAYGAETSTDWLTAVNQPLDIAMIDFEQYDAQDSGNIFTEEEDERLVGSYRYPFRIRFLVENDSGFEIDCKPNVEFRVNGGDWIKWHRRMEVDVGHNQSYSPAKGFYINNWAQIAVDDTIDHTVNELSDISDHYFYARNFLPYSDIGVVDYTGINPTLLLTGNALTIPQDTTADPFWPPYFIDEYVGFVNADYRNSVWTYPRQLKTTGQVMAPYEGMYNAVEVDAVNYDLYNIIPSNHYNEDTVGGYKYSNSGSWTWRYITVTPSVTGFFTPGESARAVYDVTGALVDGYMHIYMVAPDDTTGKHTVRSKVFDTSDHTVVTEQSIPNVNSDSTTYAWIEYVWGDGDYANIIYSEVDATEDIYKLYFMRRVADASLVHSARVLLSNNYSSKYFGSYVYVLPVKGSTTLFDIYVYEGGDCGSSFHNRFDSAANTFTQKKTFLGQHVLAEEFRKRGRYEELYALANKNYAIISRTQDNYTAPAASTRTGNSVYYDRNPITIVNTDDVGYYAVPNLTRLNHPSSALYYPPDQDAAEFIQCWSGLVSRNIGLASNDYLFMFLSEGWDDVFNDSDYSKCYLGYTGIEFHLVVEHGTDTTQQLGSGTFVTDNNGFSFCGPTLEATIPNGQEAEFEFSLSLDFLDYVIEDDFKTSRIDIRLVDENENILNGFIAPIYYEKYTEVNAVVDFTGTASFLAVGVVDDSTAPEGSAHMYASASFQVLGSSFDIEGDADFVGCATFDVIGHGYTFSAGLVEFNCYANVKAYPWFQDVYSDRFLWKNHNTKKTDSGNMLAGINEPIQIGSGYDVEPADSPLGKMLGGGYVAVMLYLAIGNGTLSTAVVDSSIQYKINDGSWVDVSNAASIITYVPVFDKDERIYDTYADVELDTSVPKSFPFPLVTNDQTGTDYINAETSPFCVTHDYVAAAATTLAACYIYDESSLLYQQYRAYLDDLIYGTSSGKTITSLIVPPLTQIYTSIYLTRQPRPHEIGYAYIFMAAEQAPSYGDDHVIEYLDTTGTYPVTPVEVVNRGATKIITFDVAYNSYYDRYVIAGVDEDMKIFKGIFTISGSTLTWVETLSEENMPDTGSTDYAPGVYGLRVNYPVHVVNRAFPNIVMIAYDGTGTYVWHRMHPATGWDTSFTKVWDQDIATSTASIKDLGVDITTSHAGTDLGAPSFSDEAFIVVTTNVTIGSDDSPVVVIKGDQTTTGIDWTQYDPFVVDSFSSSGAGTDAKSPGIANMSNYLSNYYPGELYVAYRVKDGTTYKSQLALIPDFDYDKVVIGTFYSSSVSWAGFTAVVGSGEQVTISYNDASNNINVFYLTRSYDYIYSNTPIISYHRLIRWGLNSGSYGVTTDEVISNELYQNRCREYAYGLVINTSSLSLGDTIRFQLKDADVTSEVYAILFYGNAYTEGDADFDAYASIDADGFVEADSGEIYGVASFTAVASISSDAYMDTVGDASLQAIAIISPDATLTGIVTDGTISIDLAFDVSAVGTVVTDIQITRKQDFPYEFIGCGVERDLDGCYVTVSADYEDKLLDLVNNARANVGLPAYKSYWRDNHPLYPEVTKDGPDIAQKHSQDMRFAQVFAHEHSSFPAGWQYWGERVAVLSDELCYSGAENIAAPDAEYTDDYEELFNAWMDSPGHRANILRDWSGTVTKYDENGFPIFYYNDGSNVYAQIGLTFGGTNITGYIPSWLATHNFLDFGTAEYMLNTMNKTQDFAYDLDTALFHLMDAAYKVAVYTKVEQQNEALYSIWLEVQHQSPYSPLVGTQHTSPLTWLVERQMIYSYGDLTPVHQSHTSEYDIFDKVPVGQQNESPYGITVTSFLESPYTELSVVGRQVEAPYGDRSTVEQQNESPYSLYSAIETQVESPYTATSSTGSQVESLYDMLVRNNVELDHTSYYAMLSSAPINATGTITVTINGVIFDVDSVEIVQDEGNYLWSADITLRQMTFYALVSRDDVVEIDIHGEIYNLVVEQKTVNRGSSVDVSGTIRAVSPAVKHDTPRASLYTHTFDVPVNARLAVEAILGESVQWELPTWIIPAYRLVAENAVPIAFAKTIVEATGGVLESNKDGTLRARPLFPVPVPDYWDESSTHVLTDTEDNLSQSGEYQYTEGYNRFRVREGNANFGDSIEFERYEDELGGILHCYPSPWRTTVALVHTDGPIIPLDYLGVIEREEEQEVEFTEGSASLTYPVYDILDVHWHSDVLTGFSWAIDSADLTADTDVNQGYGVATIRYKVRSIDYETDAPTGSIIQYVLEDLG